MKCLTNSFVICSYDVIFVMIGYLVSFLVLKQKMFIYYVYTKSYFMIRNFIDNKEFIKFTL